MIVNEELRLFQIFAKLGSQVISRDEMERDEQWLFNKFLHDREVDGHGTNERTSGYFERPASWLLSNLGAFRRFPVDVFAVSYSYVRFLRPFIDIPYLFVFSSSLLSTGISLRLHSALVLSLFSPIF